MYQHREELIHEFWGIFGLDGNEGDTVLFGKHPNVPGSKIEWIILKDKEDRKLLFAKKSVTKSAFHDSDSNVTWESCRLRKWLNSEFKNNVFDKVEESLLTEVSVNVQLNPGSKVEQEKIVKDKLLSVAEV